MSQSDWTGNVGYITPMLSFNQPIYYTADRKLLGLLLPSAANVSFAERSVHGDISKNWI